MASLNLIDVLSGYLMVAFVVGTILRLRNYRAILGVIIAFPGRWPRLLELAKHSRTIFLRWPTLLPITATLALMLANTLASLLVWSEASISLEELRERWWALLAAIVSGAFMVFLDCRAIFQVGRFDRAALEKDLDQAEHWMESWKAPTLRVLTLGLVNPRRIVNERVRQALVDASLVVNGQMWRWCLQVGMRLVFGFTLWMTWAQSRPATG